MMTVRQIERWWNEQAYKRLAGELLSARQEGSFNLEGMDRPAPAAALAIIRLDELGQAHVPLYSRLVRAVLSARDRDGGWGDPAPTALCLRALLLGGGHGAAIDAGLAALASMQKEEGIWAEGPLRRMPADPDVSLFVLFQLGDHPRFREVVDIARAMKWFDDHAAEMNPASRQLHKWASMRWTSRPAPALEPTIFSH